MDENLAKLLKAVEAVKAGDKEAFQEIYHRTYQKTYKIARGFFPNNEQDQDDCVQNIYMHLYRKIELYNPPYSQIGQRGRMITAANFK